MRKSGTSLWMLPVLSGLLLPAAYFASPSLLPNFVAFLPVLAWLDENARRPLGDRLRAGFIFGITTNLIILHWMYAMLEYSWLAAVLYVGLATAFALFATIEITLAGWVRHRTSWSFGLVLPACWIPFEWARTWTDVRMTADHVGHTLAGYPFLIQFADLVGPYGVGAFMLAVNGLLYDAIRSRKEARGRRAALALGATLLAVLAYDAWAWSHPEKAERTVRVGLVQPNIPLDVKHGLATEASQWKTLADLSRRAASQGARVVVWPETARPWPLRHVLDEPRTYAMPEVQALARETRAGYVVGVEYYRVQPGGRVNLYNAVMIVQADGTLDPHWSAKVYLVPFVEGVPFERVLGPVLEGREGELRWVGGGFTPGPTVEPLPVGGARVGTLVCYEELYPELARRLRNEGADFEAILTNDAWFGRTVFQRYQADIVRMRAIENRCSFVRAANTGISGYVDPMGRSHGWTGLFVPASEVYDLPLATGRTVYGTVGNVVAWLAIAMLGVSLFVSWRRREPAAAPPSPEGGAHDVEDDRPDVGGLPGPGPGDD